MSQLSMELPISLFAYLDPGSGSLLLYFIIGLLAVLVYSIKNLFFRLSLLLSRLFSKEKVKLTGKKNVVFYSEAGHYWKNFKPVIEHLSQLGIECSYYTSDPKDEGLNFQVPHFDALFIGEGRFAMMSLNYLKARMLVLTTPQLDVMHLKRSKGVDYFVHLIHAPTDTLCYKPFAFDFFDCVMCSGQHQIDHIRLAEQTRNQPPKKLLKTGLLYFDELLHEKVNSTNEKLGKAEAESKTVLVAPTWGANGLLHKAGITPLQQLLDAGFQVILRPHPQSYIHDVQLMREIESYCKKHNAICIDKNPQGHSAMSKADIMVSDTSGIIFDFAFVYEKPVIAFKGIFKASEADIAEINLEEDRNQAPRTVLWEIENKAKVASEIDIGQAGKLADLVHSALAHNAKTGIQEFRSASVFHFGCAGRIAAGQIQNLLGEI